MISRLWAIAAVALSVGLTMAMAAGSAASQGWAVAASPAERIMRATLVEGWVGADGTHVAALRIDLAPGWHTYWRVPGDTGIPPRFDWSGSRNLAAVSYEWPKPEIYDFDGMAFLGYENALILPVRLRPADPAAPIDANVAMFLGVCSDICLPAEANVAAVFGADSPGAGRSAIEAALASRALTAAEAGVASVKCSLSPAETGFDLTAELTFRAPLEDRQVAVIETSDPTLWIEQPRSEIDGNRLIARAHVTAGPDRSVLIDRKEIRLTVLDDDRAVDIPGCAAPG